MNRRPVSQPQTPEPQAARPGLRSFLRFLVRKTGSATIINVDMIETDLQLLERYTRHQAEEAFAELVRRRINLVYSAALRQVRVPQLAEEVAFSTFADLARAASRLAPDTVVVAWLYQVARRTAIDVVRREASRQAREQVATEISAMNAPAAPWTEIEPLLDEAMHALDEADRTALLLRYFENKSLREVGLTLGTGEDAARKRVDRAVERLRGWFARRGVTTGVGGIGALISAHAVQAAPAGLAGSIAAATPPAAGALVSATLAADTSQGWLGLLLAPIVAMTTATKITIALALIVAAAVPAYYHLQPAAAPELKIAAPGKPPVAPALPEPSPEPVGPIEPPPAGPAPALDPAAVAAALAALNQQAGADPRAGLNSYLLDILRLAVANDYQTLAQNYLNPKTPPPGASPELAAQYNKTDSPGARQMLQTFAATLATAIELGAVPEISADGSRASIQATPDATTALILTQSGGTWHIAGIQKVTSVGDAPPGYVP